MIEGLDERNLYMNLDKLLHWIKSVSLSRMTFIRVVI